MHKGLYARLMAARVMSPPDTGGGGADQDPGDENDAGDDAGDDQDESGDDPDNADDGDTDPEPDADASDPTQGRPEQQSRGSERIRRQQEANRAERERADRLERELAELRGRSFAQDQARSDEQRRRDEAEERAALEAMSESERNLYQVAKQNRGLQQNFTQLQRQMQDSTDANKFSAFLAREPRFSKYADRVEQLANEAARNGQFLARDLILNQLIAQDVRNGKQATQRQKDEARDRVNRARGNSGAARSNVSGSSRGGKSHVQRMEDADFAI